MEQTKCKHCDSYMKKRLYTFNLTDDNQNLFCANENCESNKNNEVSFGNKSYQIEYCCKQCHRTLLYENEKVFLSELFYELFDFELLDEYIWDNIHGDKFDDCYLFHGWLKSRELNNESHCNECENYLVHFKNYKNCDACGSLYRTTCNHKLINNNQKEHNRSSKTQNFTQNPNKERCKYCYRYMNKCDKCENSCYVCVFKDCARSQLTGMKLKHYSYLCEKHAAVATDWWAREIVKQSDFVCYECGINENYYKPLCKCIEEQSFCINCMEDGISIYKVYCHGCV